MSSPAVRRADRLRHAAPAALAVAAWAALVVAAVGTARAAAGHGYWSDGYYRLLSAWLWSRFDPWAAGLGAAALVLAVTVALARRPPPAPRRASRTALALLAAVLVLRLAAALDAWRSSRGPNVLLISIDTLRADRLGAYGAALPTSPAFDRRLAAEGVLFERCWSQSPKTTPSHMTLLTSLYPPVHGVELWEGDAPGAVLNPEVRTLADVLKNAGYATAAFTGGAHVHRSRGFGQGFDVYRHGHELPRALDWIGRHRHGKFFVFFHTYQVHDPYLPPEALVARFAAGSDGRVREAVHRLRAGIGGGWEAAHRVFWEAVDTSDRRDVELVSRLYDAGIRNMDDTTLTALLDQLDRLDLARNTLVVFTSDHGEAFAEHGVFLHDDLYAETLHVPLVLRFPGRLPAGMRRPESVRLIDVMPTVLDLLGIAVPPAAQGRSLVPLVRAPAENGPAPGIVSDYSSTRPARIFQSVRADGLTYIVDNGAERLFDTGVDPGEQRDVATTESARLATMRERLARFASDCAPLAARFRPVGPGVAPDTDTRRQLRALGYVQ